MKRVGITLFIIALLVVLGGLVYWLSGTSAPAKLSPEIISFEVEKPNLVVKTRDVASVTIFGVAQESGATSTQGDVKIGDPEKVGEADGVIEWHQPIPQTPLAVSAIYATGYDSEGTEVAQQSLPHTGARALFEALWLDDQQSTPTLGVSASTTVEGVNVAFVEVTDDGRCRAGKTCDEPGEVTALLEVTLPEADESTEASVTGPDGQTTVGQYLIQILEVSPERPAEGELEQEDYEIRFLVFREAKL